MSELKNNDDFWLEKGQTLVSETISNLNTHLKNGVIYLNGLSGFLITAATAEVFYKSSNIWIFLCYILPVVFIQFLKFKVSAGQKVLTSELDLRSPIKIREAYEDIVKKLIKEVKEVKCKLFKATVAVVIGFSIALFLNNLETQKKDEKKEKSATEKLEEVKKKLTEVNSKLKELKSIESEINKKQKFKVTQTEEVLKIEAFLLEDKTLNISYPNKNNIPEQTTFIIHKNQEYLLDLKGKNYQLTKVWLTEK